MTDIVISNSIHVEVNKEKMKIETLKGEQTNFDKINNILYTNNDGCMITACVYMRLML